MPSLGSSRSESRAPAVDPSAARAGRRPGSTSGATAYVVRVSRSTARRSNQSSRGPEPQPQSRDDRRPAPRHRRTNARRGRARSAELDDVAGLQAAPGQRPVSVSVRGAAQHLLVATDAAGHREPAPQTVASGRPRSLARGDRHRLAPGPRLTADDQRPSAHRSARPAPTPPPAAAGRPAPSRAQRDRARCRPAGSPAQRVGVERARRRHAEVGPAGPAQVLHQGVRPGV